MEEIAVPCSEKHTKYQPEDADWTCRSCGAGIGVFCITEPVETANPDCPLLHEDDTVGCMDCRDDEGESGKSFARRIQKKKGLVPCSHCKGTGLVKGRG